MSELMSCPFCGGEAQMGVNKESTVREYFVGCVNCHIRLYKVGYKRFYTEAEAIAAWNSRAERTCYIEHVKRGALCDVWRCSYCGYDYAESVSEPSIIQNYCPNCGAKVVSE